jgi:hypothetical protein
MIYLNFSLSNPWYVPNNTPEGKKRDYANLYLNHGKISENKYWEIELVKDRERILSFEFSLSWRGRDHAGINLNLGILGFELAGRIYDVRHWDRANNKWEEKKQNRAS